MRSIDECIADSLNNREEDFGKPVYTRYADDITVSVQNRGFKDEVVAIVEKALAEAEGPRLMINPKKTRFGSKASGNAFVTGIRICQDGRLTLHRKYKDHVRLLLSLQQKGELSIEQRPSIRGHLNYCAFADPPFFTKLSNKYVDLIDALNNPDNTE